MRTRNRAIVVAALLLAGVLVVAPAGADSQSRIDRPLNVGGNCNGQVDVLCKDRSDGNESCTVWLLGKCFVG